jgi:hypothetical protein
MSIKDYLKQNIPEFQQGDSNLSTFLDASGEFLDDIVEAIEHFDYTRDFNKGTIYNLENSIFSRGIDLPRNVEESSKRKYLRDISEIILKNGTEDGLKHALQMIGFESTINKAWLQNPKELQKGIVKDIKTGVTRNANIGRYFFLDFVYGNETVTDDGVFFEGKSYFDLNEAPNTITGIPIVGESYNTIPTSFDSVSKTPYILVSIDQGSFNIDVGEYYSEETGQWYTYSTSEEFELINELISYFISGGQRPTTVRFVIIISAQALADEFEMTDDYVDETTYTPDGGDDLSEDIDYDMTVEKPGTVTVNTAIGEPMPIGIQAPHLHQLSIIDPIAVGDIEATKPEDILWDAYNLTYKVWLDYQYPYIPVRPLIDISFTNNSTVSIDVYTAVDDLAGNKVDTLLTTINTGNSFNYQTTVDEHFIKFVPSALTNEHIEVTFVHNSFTQEIA